MKEMKSQAECITNAINELEKFAVEVENLRTILANKVNHILDGNGHWKVDKIEECSYVNNLQCFYKWHSICLPLLEPREHKPKHHLNYQISYAGESVAIPGMVHRPLVHVLFWTYEICENNFFAYPLKIEDYFGKKKKRQGRFGLKDSSLIVLYYDNDKPYWQYSVDLLSVTSATMDELLINPARELIENGIESWQVKQGSALDKAIVRYEDVSSFSE